jgi:hypothetical protein
VRTAIFGFLQDVAVRDWASAASRLATGEAGAAAENEPLSPEARRIEAAFTAYFDAHPRFRLDPEGRAAKHTHWGEERDRGELRVAQVLIDSEEHNDWEATFTVALAASRAANRAVVRFAEVKPVG